MNRFFAIMILGAIVPVSASAQTVNLFGNSTPVTHVDPDTNAVTLGVKFFSSQSGTISGIRFYRGACNNNGYTARLSTAAGGTLAQASVPGDCHSFVAGWKTATFASPISISAQTSYVSSYYTSNGHYGATDYGLNAAVQNGPLTAPASSVIGGNGVYTYGSGIRFPMSTYHASNYFVDVMFTPTIQQPYLSLSFSPPAPMLADTSPGGTVVAQILATWSDGSPFTGTLSFASPYFSDNGTFAISSGNLIVDPSGPGVGGYNDVTQNVTVQAAQ